MGKDLLCSDLIMSVGIRNVGFIFCSGMRVLLEFVQVHSVKRIYLYVCMF